MTLFRADVLVIGAGMAGLVAAALLAKEGHKVIVLERDIHPGGCAASFEKDGFRFAVGATVAMGFENGGLLDKLYKSLSIKPDFRDVTPAMRVQLEDRKLLVHTNHQSWFDELKRVFPGQDSAKQKFWRELRYLAAAMYHASRCYPVMPFRHVYDLWDSAKAAHPKLIPLLFTMRQSLEDRLEHFGISDSMHKSFIDGQLLDAMQTSSESCVAPNGALALDIYRYGCHYKTGGLSSIAEDLASYLKTQNGELHYATKVKKIHTEAKQVKGLSSSRGDYEAPVIISAIPLSNTADLLADTSTSLKSRKQKQAEMWGAFTLYLGVDERCLPKDALVFEQISDSKIHEEGANLLISTSPAWDSSRAPKGKRAITVSTHVDARKWLKLAQDREGYEQAKRQMEVKLLRQLERVFPNIKDGIEVFLSGSPKTFKNFTLRDGGTVGGFPQTLSHANFHAPSHRTDISGLFLAGDTIFPGQGILGTSISGYNAARTSRRYLQSRQSVKVSSHSALKETKEYIYE